MATNRRMKAARVGKGLTQLELAKLIGKKEIEVSRVETGRSTPDPDTKRRIAEVLEVPAYLLFNS